MSVDGPAVSHHHLVLVQIWRLMTVSTQHSEWSSGQIMLSSCHIVPWFFNFNILLSSIVNFSDHSFPLPAISRFCSAFFSTHEFSWPPQAHYKCWCYLNPLGCAVYMYSIYCGRVIINMSSLCGGLLEFDSWQVFRFFLFHLPVSAVLFGKAAVPSIKFQDKKCLVPFIRIPECFHSDQSVFHLVCLCFCCLDEKLFCGKCNVMNTEDRTSYLAKIEHSAKGNSGRSCRLVNQN